MDFGESLVLLFICIMILIGAWVGGLLVFRFILGPVTTAIMGV